MAKELEGKVAVVTGGSSGIGFGTAERLVAEGARVVIGDIDEERGRAAAESLGAAAAFVRVDVAETAQVQALVDFAVDTFGALHVMFNNAGIAGNRKHGLLEADFADFHRVAGINLLGVMAGTAFAARHMAANGGGSIVNTASIGGIQTSGGQGTYNVTKAGVVHFTKSAAVELGEHGIRVNCIAPGNIETEILGNMVAGNLLEAEKAEIMVKVRAFLLERQPLKLQGAPSDIAEAVLFFASERSRYITGVVLPVDGGQVAGTPAGSKGFQAIGPKQG